MPGACCAAASAASRSGARSAVFAPVANLGMIVLDEEHEASYKNGETPRYHARDVAAVRARIEGASLVLGSATPSLETMVLRRAAAPARAAARSGRRATAAAGRAGGPPSGAEGDRNGRRRLVRGARRGHRRHARPQGAGAAAAQPPRLRRVPPVPRLRRGLAVSALQHLPHGAHGSAGAALPLLRPRGAPAAHLPGLRQPGAADARLRDPAARAPAGRALPDCAARADGPRHDEHEVVAPAHSGVGRDGGGRPAARHADDREGARFPERDPRRASSMPTPVSTSRIFARRSARSSCWPRLRGARGGGPRAGACWCRPDIRPITL